jgi:hypothetical protein
MTTLGRSELPRVLIFEISFYCSKHKGAARQADNKYE